MSELVSIILPTFKRPDKLKRAINSVLNQTYLHWELVVIDDNHPKSEARKQTELYMQQYKQDARIIYIQNKENLGGALSRNEGIKKANGFFITFLDDDDEYLPEKIEKQVNLFNSSKQNNLGIVYCLSKKINQNGKTLSYSIVKAKGDALKKHLIRNITPCPTILTKKMILEEVEGFRDLINGQEYDLTLKILSKGYHIDFVNEILVIFHLHDSERISTSSNMIKGLEELYELKRPYLNLLSKKEKRELHLLYYLNKYRVYLSQKNTKKAFENIKFAIMSAPLNLRGYVELLNLLTGEKVTLVMKTFLHTFLHKLK